MHLTHYLNLLHRAQATLADAFGQVGDAHGDEPDIAHLCQRLAGQCDRHAQRLERFTGAYADPAADEPDRLHSELFDGTRSGPLGLLRDLHDLYLMTAECDICTTIVAQAAQGARDPDLLAVVQACAADTAAQLNWLRTRMKQAAPQALVVAR
jgi:hypothetical protein